MKKRLLVVDDEPMIRDVVGRLLSRAGWEVAAAGDADSARRALEERRPDLVLLDMNMPERDGLSVLAELRALEPGLAVIMVTGEADEARALDAMRMGARDYVPKPIDSAYLLESVKALLAIR